MDTPARRATSRMLTLAGRRRSEGAFRTGLTVKGLYAFPLFLNLYSIQVFLLNIFNSILYICITFVKPGAAPARICDRGKRFPIQAIERRDEIRKQPDSRMRLSAACNLQPVPDEFQNGSQALFRAPPAPWQIEDQRIPPQPRHSPR